jgi:hypothetical protein
MHKAEARKTQSDADNRLEQTRSHAAKPVVGFTFETLKLGSFLKLWSPTKTGLIFSRKIRMTNALPVQRPAVT